MKNEFETLCKGLNSDAGKPSQAGLLALKQWYSEKVSRDIPGQDIVESARHYVDVFLPNLPADKAASVPAFDDMNAVQYAASKGYQHFLAALSSSEKGVFSLPIERNGMTPLHLAAEYGHLHTVNALLQQGADPKQKNRMGQTPSYSALITPVTADYALRKRKANIFKTLESAAPNTLFGKNDSGETILHPAVMHGYESIVSYVIDKNPFSLFQPDNFMKYPIHYAVTNNQSRIISLLMKIKGISQLADSEGRVALHYAVSSVDTAALDACLRVYKDKNIDIRDFNNNTPLLCAAEAGNVTAFQVLVRHKADIHATDSRDRGVLHYAAMSENVEMLRWILEKLSLEINSPDSDGKTALDYSRQKGLEDNSSLLIGHGAEEHHRDISP